ncbi:hypothetical protein [Nocardia sp. NPDC050406]|uniref:hypothetical protein n=1 Tax=Nocardia sp. NPDC050406 TaxID=3364318 RepID=UPI0037A17B6C
MSYFGWAVPSEWRQESDNGAYTYYSATTIAASATVSTLTACRDPATAPTLDDWTTRLGTPTQTSPLSIPGAAGGWRYNMSGGTQAPATVLLTWLPNCEHELWITVYTDDAADRIIPTIVAQQEK